MKHLPWGRTKGARSDPPGSPGRGRRLATRSLATLGLVALALVFSAGPARAGMVISGGSMGGSGKATFTVTSSDTVTVVVDNTATASGAPSLTQVAFDVVLGGTTTHKKWTGNLGAGGEATQSFSGFPGVTIAQGNNDIANVTFTFGGAGEAPWTVNGSTQTFFNSAPAPGSLTLAVSGLVPLGLVVLRRVRRPTGIQSQ